MLGEIAQQRQAEAGKAAEEMCGPWDLQSLFSSWIWCSWVSPWVAWLAARVVVQVIAWVIALAVAWVTA